MNGKEFDILLLLIESAPTPCTPDEIIETVWNGTVVENNSVEKAIVNLRKILNDKAKDPRFIKTVRGKGYLFTGDLLETEELAKKEVSNPPQSTNIENFNSRNKVKYKNVLICLGIILTFMLPTFLWWKSNKFLAWYNAKVIFADDFSSEKIDSNRWTAKGKTVTVEDGIAKLSVEETNNWGRLESVFFTIDPTKPIVVKSRLKVSYTHLTQRDNFGSIVEGSRMM